MALALVVLRMAAAVLAAWQSARLAASLTGAIRSRLSSSYLRSSWEAQHETASGRLQELLTTFAQQGAVLVTSINQATAAGFSLLAILVTAVVVDPVISLAVIGATAVLGLVLRPVRNAVRGQAATTSRAGLSFATAVADNAPLGLETHVFGVQAEADERVQTMIREHVSTQRRLRFLQGLVPAVYTGLAYLAIVGGLAVVAQLDATDVDSAGAVMLLMLRSLSYGQGLQTSMTTVAASRPFLAALDDEIAHFEGARRAEGTVSIDHARRFRFADVTFRYPGAEEDVLQHIDLTFGPSEVVGIVGPSGSGKSTLVQLLLGVRSPTSGAVSVDGIDLDQIDRTPWTRLTTFVPQDAHFLSGSVAENIAFMRPGVTREDVKRAAKLAHIHDDIVGWQEGYERQVGDQGSQLSGGQRQRLIIARALVEDPDLLILDEPTSALDVRSESLIRQTLEELRSDMTIVIIAHRLSTLDICDRIMVIQDGRLMGFDTPDRLEETSEFYREALRLSGLR